MLDKNTILTLNKDPKSVDLHELALSNIKNAKQNLGATHDMLKDRFREKTVQTYDDAYKKYIELKNSGFLDLFAKKDKKQPKGAMMENAPIVPMGGGAKIILKNKYFESDSADNNTFENRHRKIKKEDDVES